jgi:2-polyprenyl-6-methoxyphenol hydroxylase-like FAD-dependent oxidoreductase
LRGQASVNLQNAEPSGSVPPGWQLIVQAWRPGSWNPGIFNVMRSEPEVLIVGAGPTGLVLALFLSRLGVGVRIIDKVIEPGTTSRALVVHARTLEFYRQLGIADSVIDAAQKFLAVNVWVNGRVRGRLNFGDIGGSLSKFPYSLIFPQDEHEKLLIAALQRRDVPIERGVELIDVLERDGFVATTLRHADGTQKTSESLYVAGCDGAHSTVRDKLNIALPGGTYSHLWYVADVEAVGPLANHEVNISMQERDVLAVFPMKGAGGVRLVGQAPATEDGASVSWDSVKARLLPQLRTEVRKVNWLSTYRVHHRVATRFRKGRVFLLGDAAHLHSPVGGQGMNTGIGDAVNLAWKLHSRLRDRSADNVIDSYEPERMAFARRLVSTTDAVFTILNSKGPFARFFRTVLVPTVAPVILRLEAGRRFAFRTVSQISINYRQSSLSEGRAGAVHGGDRLPWVSSKGDPNGFDDNHAPFDSMDWQLHVYGEPSASVRSLCEARGLAVHAFRWRAEMKRSSLTQNALYLVRPDEHIAFVSSGQDADALERYLVRCPYK